jgi:Protein of unknown function (DUF998)
MSGNLAMFCAVSGAIWLVAMVVIGGAAWDGYDHVSQYISELGATGAPHGWQVSWLGFLPIGLLITAFAFFAWRAAPRSALATIGFVGIFLFAIGYTGSAFFPCDFGCRPDNPSFSPVTMLLLALAARTWPGAMWLAVLGFIAAPLALVGLSGLLDVDSPTLGLYQRVLEATVLTWVVACGVYLGAKSKTAAP